MEDGVLEVCDARQFGLRPSAAALDLRRRFLGHRDSPHRQPSLARPSRRLDRLKALEQLIETQQRQIETQQRQIDQSAPKSMR
jgi:hypothetical protein